MPRNQIKYGAVISYISLFVNLLIGLIYTPWLINSIGKADYGLYTLAMSIIGFLAFDFGLGNATTKFVSQYRAEDAQDRVDNFLGTVAKIYLIIDFLLFVVLTTMYFFLPEIYEGLTEGELQKLRVVFIIVSVYFIISFPFIPLNGILTSYEQFIPLKACDLFQKVLVVASMAVCLLLGYGLYALVLVNSISGIIVILMKFYYVKKKTTVNINFHFWDKKEIRIIFAFVIWVTIASLSQRMIFNIAPSILGAIANTAAIAVMGVVITLEGYVYLFANAINGMFLPRLSRIATQNNDLEVLDLMIKVGRIQLYIIGFIYIWLVTFGKQFIYEWMGPDYSEVYLCVLLVAFPSVLHLPQEIGLTYIVAKNKVRLQAYVYIIMGVVNIALAIPLTKLYGVQGICFSIMISYIIRTIGLDIIFEKELNIDVLRFFKESYLKLLIPLVICLAGFILISKFYVSMGWINLIIKSAFAFLLYAIVLYAICLNDYEKQLFIAPIRRITKKFRA